MLSGEIDADNITFDAYDENDEDIIEENIPYDDTRPDLQDRVRCRTPVVQSYYISKLKSVDCPLAPNTKRALERFVFLYAGSDPMMANGDIRQIGSKLLGKFGGMVQDPIELWMLQFDMGANLLIDECSVIDLQTAYFQNFVAGLKHDLAFTLSRTHGDHKENIANRRQDSRVEQITSSTHREGQIINVGTKKGNRILGGK